MSSERVYCYDVPPTVPAGRVVVHNFVPARREPGDECYGEGEFREIGEDGFRCWTQRLSTDPPLVPCGCGWAPHLPVHYRVARLPPEGNELLAERAARAVEAEAAAQARLIRERANEVVATFRKCHELGEHEDFFLDGCPLCEYPRA